MESANGPQRCRGTSTARIALPDVVQYLPFQLSTTALAESPRRSHKRVGRPGSAAARRVAGRLAHRGDTRFTERAEITG